MPGRNANPGSYRHGFNGMEKDDELKGNGNSYDFGARMYDPKIGRFLSLDPQAKKQPGWSAYKAFLDNPIIYVDPTGETEYFYAGKWIGTDGVDNSLIAVVKNSEVAKEMRACTEEGWYVTPNSNLKNGYNDDAIAVIDKNVLAESLNVLSLALANPQTEFGSVMTEIDGQFVAVQAGQGEPGSGKGPPLPQGDVSIHNHLTYEAYYDKNRGIVMSSNAGEASSRKQYPDGGDVENVFPDYDMNIIVGRIGAPKAHSDGNGGVNVNDTRYSGIALYKQSATPYLKIDEASATKMLKGRKGKTAKRFEKNETKTAEEISQ